MNAISELRTSLNLHFNWNKARVDCFAKMLLALLSVRTVNLSEMAVAMTGNGRIESRYKRLHRFFAQFEIDYVVLAQWIFKLFFRPEDRLYLTIDRTNWFWGKSKTNVLTVAVAYEGLAVPLFWTPLSKAGNATAQEHIEILAQFYETFGPECIQGVLGDREFASGKLFGWLKRHRIPFYIRIKGVSMICFRKKKLVRCQKVFADLQPKKQGVFGMAIWVFGEKVYLAGARSERGELMIVATDKEVKVAIASYLRRWEIESLFQGLKGRGFRFEETHIVKLERIKKLMGLLAVGFCWAHKVGEWRALKRPIRLKQFQKERRPQNSFFRYGFDLLRDLILHIDTKNRKLCWCIRALLRPKLAELGAAP